MLYALDSNVIIAALSGSEAESHKAKELIIAIASGKHQAVVSSLVFGEVLSISKAEVDLAGFLDQVNNLRSIPASDAVCAKAGTLRKQGAAKLKLPDAIHLATALQASADVFVTNDTVLAKAATQLIDVKSLSDL